MRKFGKKKEVSEFEQKLVDVARVARVMEGGRRFSFRATVAIGNRKGKVGVGVAKALNVASAVEKAVAVAKRNMIQIAITGRSINHKVTSKFGASRINLIPAREGRGIIAGGSVRTILELAGIHDVSSKIMGSNNKINNARAAILALEKLTIKPVKKETVVKEKLVEKDAKNNQETMTSEKLKISRECQN